MTDIFVFINDNILWLQLVMIMVFLILSVVIWQRTRVYKELVRHYSTLMESHEVGNLESILQQLTQMQEEISTQLKNLEARVVNCETQLPESIDRVTLVRYKAFSDVGGDLSFSLALLNQKGTGVVLTGIHGRSETRIYTKGVEFFESNYPLSEEEKQVINKARNYGGASV